MGSGTGGFWDDVVPRVDAERCHRCDDCAPMATCLAQGIERNGPGSLPVISPEVCFGCYSCVGACPHRAIISPRSMR